MKILHQVGHNQKWNMDAKFDANFRNGIGDGFIFCAYSFEHGKIGKKISNYKATEYLPISLIDLQYYGHKDSNNIGKLNTYPFHPANYSLEESSIYPSEKFIYDGIKYQSDLGVNKIIIPNRYFPYNKFEEWKTSLNKINEYISKMDQDKDSYFMTIALSNDDIKNDDYIELLLSTLTSMDKVFDGYYIVCEPMLGFKQKISDDFIYYKNLTKVFSTLKKQKFTIIYGYANCDAILFSALVDIDFITIGTYENLRNFNINRFTEKNEGGPSKGWYFSEKLFNFIKAQELIELKAKNCTDLIKNDRNIFSDIILNDDFIWNSTHKPDIHKNYLLSVSNMLEAVYQRGEKEERAKYLLGEIESARSLYEELYNEHRVTLNESKDTHLSVWANCLRTFAKV